MTGSATITSLGTSVSGLKREVTFAGACVLTNSAAIVLPLGSNITTSAGDVIQFRSLGSGNWAMVGGTKSPAYLPLAGGTVVGATSIAMSTPLGNTIGSSATPWEINQSSASSGSNLNRLRTSIVRTANGTTWNDTSIQISRVVDSTQ